MKTKTSPAGEAACARRDAGFTLFELLAVLAIVALVLGSIVLAPGAGSSTAALKSAAFETAAILRHARSQAIIRRRTRSVLVDLDRRVVKTGGERKPVKVPKGIRMTVTAAGRERRSPRAAGIRFFPNGSSTGGAVRFSRNDRVLEVRVNWLTGRVTIDDRR